MAHDIFISYSSKDKQIGDAVCAALEARRLRCWMAPRDILAGMAWGEAIIDGINHCRILVLIYSAHSNASHQVIREVERAASKGIPILPFRIEDVPLSKGMEYCISTHHWLDALTKPVEQHLEHLAETVRLVIERSAGPATPSTPSKPPIEAKTTRSLLIGCRGDNFDDVLTWVPRGAALPFTAVFDDACTMGNHQTEVRVPLYAGFSRGAQVPYGPFNARLGDVRMQIPPSRESCRLVMEVHVDRQEYARYQCHVVMDDNVPVPTEFIPEPEPTRHPHIYERLESIYKNVGPTLDPDARAALRALGDGLNRLCRAYAEDANESLRQQIIDKGNELSVRLDELGAQENLVLGVPVAAPSGKPGTVLCPHCRKQPYTLVAPTQGHVFECSACHKSFWYGVGSPNQAMQVRFGVANALVKSAWSALERQFKLARESPAGGLREAFEGGLTATGRSLPLAQLEEANARLSALVKDGQGWKSLLRRLGDNWLQCVALVLRDGALTRFAAELDEALAQPHLQSVLVPRARATTKQLMAEIAKARGFVGRARELVSPNAYRDSERELDQIENALHQRIAHFELHCQQAGL